MIGILFSGIPITSTAAPDRAVRFGAAFVLIFYCTLRLRLRTTPPARCTIPPYITAQMSAPSPAPMNTSITECCFTNTVDTEQKKQSTALTITAHRCFLNFSQWMSVA